MSALLNPSNQLAFNRPFNRVVKKNLTVTNPHDQPIAFKVKTTAPKLYCVRPNSGRIEPGESIDVQVLLQQMREEPPVGVKCKDKFLVQSTFITPARETKSVNDLWTAVDGDEESKIHQQKIKVVYLPPEGEEQTDEVEHPSTITSDGGDVSYATVRQTAASSTGTRNIHDILIGGPTPPPPTMPPPMDIRDPSPPPNEGEYIIAQEETTHHETETLFPPPGRATANKPTTGTTTSVDMSVPVVETHVQAQQTTDRSADRAPIPPIITTPSNTTTNEEDVHRRYSEALAEITRLQALLAAQAVTSSSSHPPQSQPQSQTATGIRRRTTRVISENGSTIAGDRDDGAASDDGTLVESISAPEGVPVQVVAIIAVGVFIATYLFF